MTLHKRNHTSNSSDTHGHFLDGPGLEKGLTRFWLIRHAIVCEESRQRLYGALDVALCARHLKTQQGCYETLAARLPSDALWFTSPLSRAKHTAKAIFENGYGERDLIAEPRFVEQSLGNWHDTHHEEVPNLLREPSHPFWSLSATEQPPGGESMLDVCARVGHALDELSFQYTGRDIVVVSHGGAIRAAIAHALRLHPETALKFSVQNLSLTILERVGEQWRLITSNEVPTDARATSVK